MRLICVSTLRSLAAALLLCLFTALAPAQYDSGSVLGVIHDASGAAIANATIQVRNIETGVTQTAKTDASGHYEVAALRVGRYQIEASAQGFSTALADNISVQVGGRQRIDLGLKVGASDTTVEVSDVALQVDTESSQRSDRHQLPECRSSARYP